MYRLKYLSLTVLVLGIVGCGGGDGSTPDSSRRGSPVSVLPVATSVASSVPSVGMDGELPNYEEYALIHENEFKDVATSPLSTFSIDVDTASYSNIRRYISLNHQLPPIDAVRTEEMLNYFNYKYGEPNSTEPFKVNKYVGKTLWNEDSRLIQIGLQTKKVDFEKLPHSNLVFLLDVSGSMYANNKLPLLQDSLKLLIQELREEDTVSIVVYAGSSGLVLNKARGDEKGKIIEAIDSLRAGGSTAGGAGIELAYKVALESFIKDGNNRIILATDGDFNVGVSSQRELEDLIEEKRKSGIYLTVLGFGMGNYNDTTAETLADKGNGNYAYIDNLLEAKKVLVTEMGGTLYTVAKDVKIQVEFNPLNVSSYRLIGYENRELENEDFNDDKKDAGEIGMGHSVTVLYEIKMTPEAPKVDPLKYQDVNLTGLKDELATVKIRYKEPDANSSILLSNVIHIDEKNIEKGEFDFVQTIAGFSMILRDSKYRADLTIDELIELAKKSKGDDKEGYRAGFIELMKEAKGLD